VRGCDRISSHINRLAQPSFCMPASYTTGVVFLSEGAAEQRSSPANNASSHFAGSCPTTVHGLGTLSGERMHFHLPCPSRHLDVLLGRVARQPEDDRMSVELHLGGHLLPKRLGAGLWQDSGRTGGYPKYCKRPRKAARMLHYHIIGGPGLWYLCDTLF
jgi:hypothetical protein